MKTPVTSKRIRDHFAYAWWKYLLLAVIAVFTVNIYYTMTRYQPPEEKKIVLGLYAYGSETALNEYMEQVRTTAMPDMELMEAQFIAMDEAYGEMILTTRISARECDLYALPRTQFQNYAADGGFMAIDQVLPELVALLEEQGVSLSRGWRELGDTGEKHLYGIPCAGLPGMKNMMYTDPSDSLFFETGNDENAIAFFDRFVRDMLLETPATPTDLVTGE